MSTPTMNAVRSFRQRYAGEPAAEAKITAPVEAAMLEAYERAYDRIFRMLSTARKEVDYGTYAKNTQLLKQVGQELDRMKGTMGEHLFDALTKASEFSARNAIKDLELLTGKVTKAETWHAEYGVGYVKAAFTDSYGHIAAQTKRMKGSVKDMLRKEAAQVFQRAAVEGLSRQKAYAALRDEILTKDPTFTFTDKAGKNWDARNYFDMLTRTVMHTTMREAYVNECAKQGNDLVKVSRHQTAANLSKKGKKEAIIKNRKARSKAKTKKARKGAGYVDDCSLWEGVVLSLSGATKGYPTLADAQNSGEIFHPRCRHRLLAYHPSREKALKAIDDGKSDEEVMALFGIKPEKAEEPKVAPAPKPQPKEYKAKTKAQAKRDSEKIVKDGAADPNWLWTTRQRYTAGRFVDGEYIEGKTIEERVPVMKFKHPGYTWKTRTNLPGKVIHDKYTDLDCLNVMNTKLAELSARAKRMGIPPLRGLRVSTGEKGASGSMGDGILFMHSKIHAENARIEREHLDPKGARVRAEKQIEVSREAMNRIKEMRDNGALDDTAYTSIVSNIKADIAKAQKVVKDIDAGEFTSSMAGTLSTWKRGDSDDARPFTASGGYFIGFDSTRCTMEHEFAHHVHQQLNVKNEFDYGRPPVESKLTKMFNNRTSKSASKYAETNPKEWFAENYSLYKMGRKDLVSPDLLEYIETIVAMEVQ